jgi:hypothetical protein
MVLDKPRRPCFCARRIWRAQIFNDHEINAPLEFLADAALDPVREVPAHFQLAIDVAGVDGELILRQFPVP